MLRIHVVVQVEIIHVLEMCEIECTDSGIGTYLSVNRKVQQIVTLSKDLQTRVDPVQPSSLEELR